MAGPSVTNLSNSAQPPAASSYSKWGGLDSRYMVKLVVTGEGGESFMVDTSVDETLAVAMNAQWAAPFENVVQEMASGASSKAGPLGRTIIGGVTTSAQLAGLAVKSKYSSVQTWQSSSPMDFTIPFTLVAIEDPIKDIRDKVVNLLKLAAPSEDGAILRAPGPTMLHSKSGGRTISLEIGTYIKLSPCIVTDVQVQFDNVIGELGLPLRAKVSVSIRSWYTCFTTNDIDKMFGVSG